jgi:hypothetical protein
MTRASTAIALCAALTMAACGDKAESEPQAAAGTGVIETGTGWVFRTDHFTLGPGEERSVCWAADAPDQLAIKRFSVVAKPMFHHLFLSSVAGAEEPYGASECDALFKLDWNPMFVAGAGDAELGLPDGAARYVDAGSQLVLQLHLVNAGSKTVTDFAEVKLEESLEQSPDPVGLYVFGTTDFALPPKQSSRVQAECEVGADARIFGIMPHMHHLGRKLTLELGADATGMSPIYARDPYDYDQQTIEPLDLTISPGMIGRVTCSYDNDRSDTVRFGEGAAHEMCFAIGFGVGTSPGASVLDGCAR